VKSATPTTMIETGSVAQGGEGARSEPIIPPSRTTTGTIIILPHFCWACLSVNLRNERKKAPYSTTGLVVMYDSGELQEGLQALPIDISPT
jgi:hypothetical protein